MDVVEIEENIIGILLNDQTYLEFVKNRVAVEDFTKRELRVCFAAISELSRDGHVVSPHSLSASYPLDAIWLLKLKQACISTKNILSWCSIMREMVAQRELEKCTIKASSQNHLALYLEETAAELRTIAVTPAWVRDMLQTTVKALNDLSEDKIEFHYNPYMPPP